LSVTAGSLLLFIVPGKSTTNRSGSANMDTVGFTAPDMSNTMRTLSGVWLKRMLFTAVGRGAAAAATHTAINQQTIASSVLRRKVLFTLAPQLRKFKSTIS
jgi:uncharacterized membrane protein